MDVDGLIITGFCLGVLVCAFMVFFLGIAELYNYNSSDVTRGRPFELDDKIYKCSELKFD